jgi:hypothetical protein
VRPLFEELDSAETPMGTISLRRRLEPSRQIDVYEVKLGDEFLMSSLFTVAEIELARLGLAAADGDDLDVLVGGLGLGYTAQAALETTASAPSWSSKRSPRSSPGTSTTCCPTSPVWPPTIGRDSSEATSSRSRPRTPASTPPAPVAGRRDPARRRPHPPARPAPEPRAVLHRRRAPPPRAVPASRRRLRAVVRRPARRRLRPGARRGVQRGSTRTWWRSPTS